MRKPRGLSALNAYPHTLMTPTELKDLVEEASKCQCLFLGMDPDELVDAAKLTGQPEGTPPQMVPRWQLHQQGVSDILNQKQANINQMQGLFGLGQQVGVPQFDNFTASGAYQTPDLMGAAQGQYNAGMDKTNAANSDSNRNAQVAGTVVMAAAAAF